MAEGLVLTEQRRLSRRELIYYLKIVDLGSGQELGRMADIHAEGMLVLSGRPLAAGRIYKTELELPKAFAAEGNAHLKLTLEALWAKPGPKNSTYFESGVRFLNPDDASQVIIDRLIESFAMPS